MALFSLGTLLSLVGCDASPATDAGATDAPSASDAGSDAPTAIDAPALSDAGDDAATASDAGSDAGGEPDAGDCAYTALDEVIVLCDGDHTFVSRIGVFPPSAECPDFYVVGGRPTHYESSAQAIEGEACDDSCEWHFAMSVSRIYCGVRGGYEVLSADGPGCPDVYRFDDGYYPSVEAHDAAHPCP